MLPSTLLRRLSLPRPHLTRPSSSSLKTPNPLRQKTAASTTPLAAAASAGAAPRAVPVVDAVSLVRGDINTMFKEIHEELDAEMKGMSELSDMAKYYFDGEGKAIRPVIAMCLGHAVNAHLGHISPDAGMDSETVRAQRKVAIISEMIHTASLVHDDILDHAETRRGKAAVNRRWDISRSAMCGDYILAVGAKVLAQLRNTEVLIVLSKVLSDLVLGEFQQLQNKSDDSERFQLYLSKTFNKTASLIAYSCKANAILGAPNDEDLIERSYQYGRNVGIAFQLVDDILDFESSSALLGKPAAADLKLGLATAPVLFASAQFPELEELIARRFSQKGDVEHAFSLVGRSDGLARTRDLARSHCAEAVAAIEPLADSQHKWALITLTERVLDRNK